MAQRSEGSWPTRLESRWKSCFADFTENSEEPHPPPHGPAFKYGWGILFLRPEGKRHGGEDADKGGDVVPGRHGLEIKEGEHHEYHEGDDFLDDLQLVGGVSAVTPAVGRHLQHIFKKRDAPAHHDDNQERLAFEFQVAVPGAGHEKVGANEQHDGQPAGLSEVVHKMLRVIWLQTGRLPTEDSGAKAELSRAQL
jgi:hypothetical protein